MKNKIIIYIIEYNKLIQEGLHAIFSDIPEFNIAGTSTNTKEAIHKLKTLDIDVLLLDITLQTESPIDFIGKIRDYNKKIKIIVISSDENKETIFKYLSLGIYAYILKDIDTDILISIIKSVNDGAMWLAPKVVEYIRENNKFEIPNKKISRNDFKNSHSDLTQREYEVLKLIVEGKSNNDIANILCISEHTAKAHVCNIIQKLVVDDRTQAAVKALKNGLV